MRKLILMLVIAWPFASNAQYWRVQAYGGIGTLGVVGGAQTVYIGARIPIYASPAYMTSHIPEGKTVFPAFGASVLRRTGNFEIGIQGETIAAKRTFKTVIPDFDANGTTTSVPFRIIGHVGRPVVPITALYNYYPGPKKGNAFVGVHAGVAYAVGRNQADFNEMPLTQEVNIYYHSAWGFTGGVQLGYRKEIGPVDLGFMLQMKYMQFNLKHGSDETSYRTRLLVLPAQLYFGYRFGAKKPKPESESENTVD